MVKSRTTEGRILLLIFPPHSGWARPCLLVPNPTFSTLDPINYFLFQTYFLVLEGVRKWRVDRERGLLLHALVHASVGSCVCPERTEPTALAYRDDPLTSGATWPGPRALFSESPSSSSHHSTILPSEFRKQEWKETVRVRVYIAHGSEPLVSRAPSKFWCLPGGVATDWLPALNEMRRGNQSFHPGLI